MLDPQNWQLAGFGIYVHWPFCAHKCPYCDFNSHVATSIDHEAWERAYISEIRRLAQQVPERTVRSIFFGGGTPSLMDPRIVERVVAEIGNHWRLANDIEITLEANPTSIEAGRFAAYRRAGVNRVSMGIQALDDDALSALGRNHSAAEALRALEVANTVFQRVNFDLIYARQNQTLESWRLELASALDFAGSHISLYQLTIEDGTVFGKRQAAGKLFGLPNEDLCADMYLLTEEMTANRGLLSYEVSNHAQPGAESAHNLIYWRGGDYVGIGPGAHGRLTIDNTRFATNTSKSPNIWLRNVLTGGSGELERQSLSQEDRAIEYLLMSLRLKEGTSLSRYERMLGRPMNEAALEKLQELGKLVVEGDSVKATLDGRLVLNAVLSEIVCAGEAKL